MNYNVVLAFDKEWTIEAITELPEGVQPQISIEELIACERIVRNDKKVQELAKAVGTCVLVLHMSFCAEIDDRQVLKRIRSTVMVGLSDTTNGSRRREESSKRWCLLDSASMRIYTHIPWSVSIPKS